MSSSPSSRKKRHILVTGGGGFIGSHLCEALLVRGYSVTALDNFVTGQMRNLDEARDHEDFSLVEADVCDPLRADLWPLLKRDGLFGVFHFACPASPIDFEKIPMEILKVDSVGTIHAVDLAVKFGARLMLASTSEVYGDPLVHPQKETYWGNVNPIGPRACYDETKRFGEAYVSSAARPASRGGMGLNAGIVRIFNTYGPRMRADDGRVVPELCIQGLQGKPLTIHGDGKQTRSFCYVSDLVEGIVRAFESSQMGPFNLGNPSERTILEFAEAVRQLTGTRSSIEHLPGREDDPRRRCPDITRAKSELGWTPKIDLQEGLRRTIEYFRDDLAREG